MSILKWLAGLLLGAVAKAGVAWAQQKRNEQHLKELGHATGELKRARAQAAIAAKSARRRANQPRDLGAAVSRLRQRAKG